MPAAFELRPFQKQAINALKSNLRSAHVICVAPTGSGKSLIYEEIAAMANRRTLLVTPLVALARQQFEKMKTRGISVTLAAGGSAQGPPATSSGAWIVSPESLQVPSRQNALARWRPNFLVLDECHCLWEWGEKFRPAFNIIPPLLACHEIQRSLWLTATLPYPARLQLRSLLPEFLEIGKFSLSSQIYLRIERASWEIRTGKLLEWVRKNSGCGIIFVSTREGTSRLARLLSAVGKRVVQYHAGMSVEERQNIEKLISEKIPEIIIATSAFGMGMDYEHLSYVVLWQVPPSLLALVQTIGRVGRNQESRGKALVFWDPEDFKLLEWTLQNSERRRQELLAMVEFLTAKECRQVSLIRYFDQTQVIESCNQCDFCDSTGWHSEMECH